jgi:arylsulfatase A-like enzyme
MSDGSPAAEHRSLKSALALAAAWAMIASAGEYVVLLVGWYGFGKPTYVGIDAIWAKPLVNLLLFLAAAVVLYRLPARFLVACLAFAATAATLLPLRPGSPAAMTILSAGIGTQLGILLASARRQALVVRAGKLLAAVFGVAIVVSQASRGFRERSSPGVAAEAGAPNVLLIILDTVRAASLARFGGRASTPHLDSLAATGMVFDRAVATAPWTLPSHASMFTGLWPHEHGADWRIPLDDRAPTLAEVLARHGYRTGGFVANLVYTSREQGLDRGFQVYRDYRRSLSSLLRSSSLVQTVTTSPTLRRLTGFHEVMGRKAGPDVNQEFLAWQARDDARPWFAFLNYYDSHEPYLPRDTFAGRYSEGQVPRRLDQLRFWNVEGAMDDWDELSAAEVEAERAAYEETITGLDADIGALLAALRARGVLDRTLVILTSDHGELFGEHGAHGHGNSVFWQALHVPLVISWPGHVRSGERVTEPVSLRDLAATILSVAFPGAARELPGSSLTTVTDSARPRSLTLSDLSLEEFTRHADAMQHGALQSLAGTDWQYIRAGDGHEDVYRIGAGTGDTLVTVPAVRDAVLDTARARLAAARTPPPPRD